MVQTSTVVGLALLLLAAVGTFLAVFFSVEGKKASPGPEPENGYFKAAVAADAGTCSEIGRFELYSPEMHIHFLPSMALFHRQGLG